MKVKKIIAADMRQAMRKVREEVGPDAVILSNKRVATGVEILVAVEFDESKVEKLVDEPVLRAEPRAQAYKPAMQHLFEKEQKKTAYAEPRVERTAPAFSSAHAEVEPPRPRHTTVDNSGEYQALKSELAMLRSMMESQLEMLDFAKRAKQNPLRMNTIKKLMAMGLSHKLAEEFAAGLPSDMDPKESWRVVLKQLGMAISVPRGNFLEQGGIIALAGPTGVGKTTTIAKLAALYTLKNGSRNIAIVSTDNFRIGAHEQLLHFARIMDLPLHTANSQEQLAQVLHNLRDKHLVLIDTAGMSQRDVRLAENFRSLSRQIPAIQTYLVMSANSQLATLQEIAQSFAQVPLAGAIVTKTDEAASLGGVISTLIRHRLPLAYVGNGQRVPEDLELADGDKLVAQAVKRMQESVYDIHPDIFAAATANAGRGFTGGL